MKKRTCKAPTQTFHQYHALGVVLDIVHNDCECWIGCYQIARTQEFVSQGRLIPSTRATILTEWHSDNWYRF